MKRQNSLKTHHAAFIFACLVSVVLWFLPFARWITVPLQYLNTHIHEAWHAFAAFGTGGEVHHIQVHANGNGETYTLGGNSFLISTAGYVGAALVGALMIGLSKSPQAAKVALITLSLILAYSLIVWVRQDIFGIVSAIFWIAALWGATLLRDDKRLFAAQFIGVQQCLNSIQSLFFLVKISGFGMKQSDAGNMQQLTGIPAIVWAVIWCGISLGLMVVALRITWREDRLSSPAEPTMVP